MKGLAPARRVSFGPGDAARPRFVTVSDGRLFTLGCQPTTMHGPRTAALAVALSLLLGLSPVAALPLDAGAGTTTGATAHPSITDAGPVGPASIATPPVTGGENTTAYLAIDPSDIESSRFATATIDVGGAAALDRADLRGRHAYFDIIESFTAGGTTADRQVALESAFDRLETHVASLERRERAALAAFNRGDMSPRTYLRELAIIDASADALSDPLAQTYEYTDSMRNPPVPPERIAELKSRLVGLRGPVRDRTAAAMRGESEPLRVFVETSDTGVVLATVSGSEFNRQYVREAYLPTARDPDGADGFRTDRGYDLEAARDRASELYPWTFANAGPTSTGLRTGEPYLYRAGVYSISVDHPHGTAGQGDLVTYLDGATGQAFREIQFKDVSDVPVTAPRSNLSEGLRVEVNRTHVGGPVSVRVTENTTDAPVAAQVYVDGEPVGTTGADGLLWTVAPRESFTVTASTGDRNVTVGPMFPYA
jgi:hypothetical protein